MINRYEPGTKVKVRSDLDVGKIYGGLEVTPEMFEYRGQPAIILQYDEEGTVPAYLLSVDMQFWSWTEDMLELIPDEKIIYFSDVLRKKTDEELFEAYQELKKLDETGVLSSGIFQELCTARAELYHTDCSMDVTRREMMEELGRRWCILRFPSQ